MILPPFIDDFEFLYRRTIDGDNVEGWLIADIEIPSWTITIRTPLDDPVSLRAITLDTPERGEVGWANARDDVTAWIREHPSLRAQVYGDAGFGRILADIYDADDRQDTLSQHMLLQRGWKPWVPR